jgi:hypothetical protein
MNDTINLTHTIPHKIISDNLQDPIALLFLIPIVFALIYFWWMYNQFKLSGGGM